MASVTVIGAGCIGLTTAHALDRAGHHVRVIAAHTGADITSFVAGAVWFPFRCGPADRVNQWSATTREWLTTLARDHPEAGVDVLTMFQIADDDSRPWFADAAPDAVFTRRLPVLPLAPAAPSIGAWRFPAPRVEPALYLPWIESRLPRPIERRRLGSLAEAFAPSPNHPAPDFVVNCTGLTGRSLTADPALLGIYGHVLICEPGDIDMSVSVSDDRQPDALLYTIPRRHTVVIGGCSEPSEDDRLRTPEPAMREAILARCRASGWTPGAILRETTGLRPFRPSVRLELDRANTGRAPGGRFIHNYGHGGAGYTMMWGCAQEVVRLVEENR